MNVFRGGGNDLRHYLGLVSGLWVSGHALEEACGTLVFSSSPEGSGFALPCTVPAMKLCLVADQKQWAPLITH